LIQIFDIFAISKMAKYPFPAAIMRKASIILIVNVDRNVTQFFPTKSIIAAPYLSSLKKKLYAVRGCLGISFGREAFFALFLSSSLQIAMVEGLLSVVLINSLSSIFSLHSTAFYP